MWNNEVAHEAIASQRNFGSTKDPRLSIARSRLRDRLEQSQLSVIADRSVEVQTHDA